jgi:predicted metal-dependent hydrolase
MKYMKIDQFTIELEKKRIKNMYLKVLAPDGRIVVTAPFRMKDEEIKTFIMSKLSWIEQHQLKILQKPVRTELSYVTDEILTLWGQSYTLNVLEQAKRPKVTIIGDVLQLSVSKDSTLLQRKAIIDKWYKEKLSEQVPYLIHKWEKLIGVQAGAYRIRDMKSRWGSCNIQTHEICINLQLAKRPLRCLEYVVVHELVHLLEKSHNKIFWGYMDVFMPEWKKIRLELKTNVQ